MLVDRWNRHRLLVVTQVLSMVQSAALAALALTGDHHRLARPGLSVFQGLINAFDMPARQAFVVQMVEDREDLANAIALNSSMVNAARLIGPVDRRRRDRRGRRGLVLRGRRASATSRSSPRCC